MYKKIILSIFLISSILFGGEFKIHPQGWVSLGFIDSQYNNSTNGQFGCGIGWFFDNDDLIYGANLGFGYFKHDYSALYLDFDIKGGKRINKKSYMYLLGGYRMSSYDNHQEDSKGFGIGFGSGIQFSKYWSINVEYKYYNLKPNDEKNVLDFKFIYSF